MATTTGVHRPADDAQTRDERVVSPPLMQRVAVALVVFAIGTLVLAHPALSGQTLLNPNSDQYIAGYAFRDFAAQWLRSTGSFPLWNPYLFGGMPYVAAMHGDIFYPTFLLRLLMQTGAAMTWGMILHVFFSGCFTWVFLHRALRIGYVASIIGGLAYMMGGNVAGQVSPGHDGKIFVATLLPLVLFFVHRGVRDGRAWAWGALAVSVTLAVLTPHPQLLQYLLLVSGAYALYLALSADATGHQLARPLAVRRLALAAVAVAIGMLGGAIQFWPLMEYIPWSPRAVDKGWEHAISYSLPPEEILNTYLPQFSGVLRNYAGRNGIHLHSEYIGAAVLVLAGLAFSAGQIKRSMIWFWTGTLVVATLWALGGYTPFFHLVYLVPGTKSFRAPSTMLYVMSFCTAIFAAIGAERAIDGKMRTKYAIVTGVLGLLVAVMASSGALTNVAMALVPTGYGLEDRVMANASALTLGAWRSFGVVAVTVALCLAASQRMIAARFVGFALAAVVAVDLWSIERLYWMFAPPTSELYAGDAVIDYIKKQPEPGRVLALAVQDLTGTRRDPYLGSGEGKGTGFMVHGIRSVSGYHGNELGRYDELTGWDTNDYLKQLANPQLRQLLNVRYLYANGTKPPLEGATMVAGPVTNAAGNSVSLFELPGEHADAWVTLLTVKVPDANALATLQNPQFDARTAMLVDPSSTLPTQPVPSTPPPRSDVRVHATTWTPGHIVLALDQPAPANAALVVSENFYPGWTATVDGKATAVERADYVLMGLALPAGAKNVELTFTSPRFQTGKLLTLLALGAAVLWMIVGVVIGRSRAAGTGLQYLSTDTSPS